MRFLIAVTMTLLCNFAFAGEPSFTEGLVANNCKNGQCKLKVKNLVRKDSVEITSEPYCNSCSVCDNCSAQVVSNSCESCYKTKIRNRRKCR